MNKLSKILFSFVLLCSIGMLASALKGVTKRKLTKVHINIVPFTTLKRSIPFNLRAGLTYKSSYMLNRQQIGGSLFSNNLISYKKGNTIYILPYKQKVLIPDYKASTGYKLIIRPK